MTEMLVLSESEVEIVAGGGPAGNIAIQTNINVNPQIALGLAVLSPNAVVNANNHSLALQLNLANLR